MSEEPAILGAFASHKFIKGLGEHHRMRLATGVKPFRAAVGDYLARAGEPAHAFYLIQRGVVAIGTDLSQSDAVPIQTVGPGDVVGWSWLLPPYRWQFDARVTDAVQGLSFDGGWLRELCEQDYALGYHLTRQLLAMVTSRLTASRRHP
jgi:CRP/FNR family cyclic AMP-dependent transcriptional regulator